VGGGGGVKVSWQKKKKKKKKQPPTKEEEMGQERGRQHRSCLGRGTRTRAPGSTGRKGSGGTHCGPATVDVNREIKITGAVKNGFVPGPTGEGKLGGLFSLKQIGL